MWTAIGKADVSVNY